MAKTRATVRHPRADEAWRDNLRTSAMKVGFGLMLSKGMLEYLCAVSDGVQWDRSLYYQAPGVVDNWMAPLKALVKRGLIQRMSDEKVSAMMRARRGDETGSGEWNSWELTPAGKLVVELVTMAGMFVEADAAISKKARRA